MSSPRPSAREHLERDTALKDMLSPYSSDRSALTDCRKLAESSFGCHKALMVYRSDYEHRPLD